MFGGLLIVIVTGILSFYIIGRMKAKRPYIDDDLLKRMFWYHILLSLAYYGYVFFNPSDSKFYYEKVVMDHRGENWMDYYGTSTTFIEFIGYPFIKYLSFSYEGTMALFSFFGFLGFLYFYIFFRENIRFKHTFMNVDLLTLIFFLPNLHFWSASFGKGSVIFLGIGLFFYGITNVRERIIPILIGGFIIYHVRPHVMLVILISSAIGFVFTTKGVSASMRVLFLAGCTVAFFFIYKDVLSIVGIDEDQALSQGFNLTSRARELTKATSGVDITNYSLPMQVFTFLYRPLFIDAPGVLGIIVSFENVIYLILTLKMLSSWRGIRYLVTGNFLSKTAFFSFITVSIALAQIAGNLGLAMRQKSQVMILFMFVLIMFLDQEKMVEWRALQLRKLRLKKRQQDLLRLRPEASN
jgi:hypothetical protein